MGTSPTARLLRLLVEQGPLHRAEIARRMSVSRARVTALVREECLAGRMVEIDPARSAPLVDDDPKPGRWVAGLLDLGPVDGRAGPPIAVAPAQGLVAGAQLSAHHTAVLVTTLSGVIVGHRHRPRPSADQGSPGERAALIRALLEEIVGDPRRIVRIGVGGFGRVDAAQGRTHAQPPTRWAGQPVRELLEDALESAVLIENNMRLDSIAEARWGAGRPFDPILYVHASGGLGATLVVGGEPITGVAGAAGELGHVSVDINGPRCRCGNRGCAELTASATLVREQVEARRGSPVAAAEVAALARSGDPDTVEVLQGVSTTLGMLLASLGNLLAPEAIVIGGELAHWGDRFIDDLADVYRRHAFDSPEQPVLPAVFGAQELGGAMAASLLARRDHVRQLIGSGNR